MLYGKYIKDTQGISRFYQCEYSVGYHVQKIDAYNGEMSNLIIIFEDEDSAVKYAESTYVAYILSKHSDSGIERL